MLEAKTGWKIERVGKSLIDVIHEQGGFLPNPKSRYCTRICKIHPMEQFIGKDEATIYYGLRADENRKGYVPVGGSHITPAYPLQEMGIDLRGVYSILDAQELSPPTFFWQKLYDAVSGIMSVSGWSGWQDRLTRSEKQSLFAGRSRGNCFFCFFQRQYEIVWLYETHPDLFAIASGLEREDFTFRAEYALSAFDNEHWRRTILEDRATEVAQTIQRKFQERMFEFQDNEISLTSCGLLCGK